MSTSNNANDDNMNEGSEDEEVKRISIDPSSHYKNPNTGSIGTPQDHFAYPSSPLQKFTKGPFNPKKH